MKAKNISLFTFLLLIANVILLAGTASGQNINSVGEFVIDVRNGATFEYEIHPSLPIFVFHLIPDSQYNVISTIEICKKGHPDIIQTLESGMGEAPYRDADYFQAEDMNFDGYKEEKHFLKVVEERIDGVMKIVKEETVIEEGLH